jgi:DNA-binding HxlR family transcriptional regulator
MHMETIAKKRTRKQQAYCPVETVTQLVGGKWKTLILHHLMDHDVLRFGELKRRIPGITQKMLTNQLRELEADGLIVRKVYPEVPPKVEYSLTDLGKSLAPIIQDMKVWGEKYLDSKGLESVH